MKTVFFATGNKDKAKEASEILGVKVEICQYQVDEVQSLDPVEVATKKAASYYKKIKKPIFVEDTSLTFEALGRLPGTYINDFLKELGNDGLAKLLSYKENRNAVAGVVVVYFDNNAKKHIFEAKVKGKIALNPRGKNGFGWDAIFIPKGSEKTFAQMNAGEKNKYSMRGKAFEKFKNFLKMNP
jgi:non-canonical purine NTP pyrophosphatase (RdgB/HAM1 family)